MEFLYWLASLSSVESSNSSKLILLEGSDSPRLVVIGFGDLVDVPILSIFNLWKMLGVASLLKETLVVLCATVVGTPVVLIPIVDAKLDDEDDEPVVMIEVDWSIKRGWKVVVVVEGSSSSTLKLNIRLAQSRILLLRVVGRVGLKEDLFGLYLS